MDKAVVEAVQRARERAVASSDERKRALERAERWRKLLQVVTALAYDRPAMTASTLARAQRVITDHESEYSEAVSALRAMWQDCQQRARAAAAESVRTFPDAVEEVGLNLDSSSRHPRYILH